MRQQQVQEVHGRPVARPQPVQQLVEARWLVASDLLEAEPLSRGLLRPQGRLLPGLCLVDEQGRVEGGVVRVEDLRQDPSRVSDDARSPDWSGSPTNDAHWRGGQSW